MGCKGSKDAKEDKQINGDFERIKMVRFDEVTFFPILHDLTSF